jgi:RHS repeat-associated protein
VEESSNTQRTPYLFTGKELDEETGLYYFGARYYDARTGVWQSTDPILGKYLPTAEQEENAKLPGIGGVFKSNNLSLYGYVGLNPLNFVDPTGEARKYIDLGGGWKGGIDQFNIHGAASHEIHVFDKAGKEVGVLGPKGWIPKHGHSGEAPKMPKDVSDRLMQANKGIMQKQGNIPKEGGKESGKANGKGAGVVRGLGAMGLLSGILNDLERLKRANEGGKSFSDQVREDAGSAPFIMTPLGPLPNIYQEQDEIKERQKVI